SLNGLKLSIESATVSQPTSVIAPANTRAALIASANFPENRCLSMSMSRLSTCDQRPCRAPFTQIGAPRHPLSPSDRFVRTGLRLDVPFRTATVSHERLKEPLRRWL